jgi:hypothetical protein
MMSDQPSAGRELDVLVARALDLPEGAYSTELMASWEVAQWLSHRGYKIDVDTWAGGGSSVRISSPVDEERAFHGATPAEALCRAAVAMAEEGEAKGAS